MFRIVCFVFLLFPISGWSQTEMFDKNKVEKTDQEVYVERVEETQCILIIPFEEKLFYCDIMRNLTAANDMNSKQIMYVFRNDIQLSLKAALRDSLKTATFLTVDSITDAHLIKIYSQLGYSYIPIPVKEEKEEETKRDKNKKQERVEVKIRNGQIMDGRNNVPRYMSASLKDNTILSNLYKTKGINRFLFINQMDVKMDLSDAEMAFVDPKRVVGLHYTILDASGKHIAGGLAMQQFAATQNNINSIVTETFYKLATEVVNNLRLATEKKEDEKKKDGHRSKIKPEK